MIQKFENTCKFIQVSVYDKWHLTSMVRLNFLRFCSLIWVRRDESSNIASFHRRGETKRLKQRRGSGYTTDSTFGVFRESMSSVLSFLSAGCTLELDYWIRSQLIRSDSSELWNSEIHFQSVQHQSPAHWRSSSGPGLSLLCRFRKVYPYEGIWSSVGEHHTVLGVIGLG